MADWVPIVAMLSLGLAAVMVYVHLQREKTSSI